MHFQGSAYDGMSKFIQPLTRLTASNFFTVSIYYFHNILGVLAVPSFTSSRQWIVPPLPRRRWYRPPHRWVGLWWAPPHSLPARRAHIGCPAPGAVSSQFVLPGASRT